MIMRKDAVAAELKSDADDEASFLNEIMRLSREYPDMTVRGELYFENYVYAVLHEPGTQEFRELFYYNDYDDYEDEIGITDDRWPAMFRQ
ncbi:MAG: hypothetical protein IKF00_05135 [Solobacterium sp.]|nr:hypothetical protein [Solobacterium sp.]